MGYRLNHFDEPVLMAVSKPLLTEFGIHHRLESCVPSLGPGGGAFLMLCAYLGHGTRARFKQSMTICFQN